MAMFPAFFDTCTLYGAYLCDSLLRLAEAGTYRPLWSADVLDELERALVARGLEKTAVTHRIGEMRRAFPDAEVRGYENIVETMTCDPKDRHVLAAAVRSDAAVLVTFNTGDFPDTSTAAYDITVVTRTISCSTSLTSTRDTRSRPCVTRHAATPLPP
jgi:predicted nucleic acid-binding protein